MDEQRDNTKGLSGAELVGLIDTVEKAEEGEWMQLEGGDGRLLPARIKVAGSDSERQKKHDRIVRNKAQKRGRRNVSSMLLPDYDTSVNDDLAGGVALTVAWDWGPMEKAIAEAVGVPIEQFKCEPVIIRKVYTRFPIILSQVWAFSRDTANFIKA